MSSGCELFHFAIDDAGTKIEISGIIIFGVGNETGLFDFKCRTLLSGGDNETGTHLFDIGLSGDDHTDSRISRGFGGDTTHFSRIEINGLHTFGCDGGIGGHKRFHLAEESHLTFEADIGLIIVDLPGLKTVDSGSHHSVDEKAGSVEMK